MKEESPRDYRGRSVETLKHVDYSFYYFISDLKNEEEIRMASKIPL